MARKRIKCEGCRFYKTWRYSRPDCLAVITRSNANNNHRQLYGDPEEINRKHDCKLFEDKSCTMKIVQSVTEQD